MYWIWFFIFLNCLVALITYRILFRKRRLFSERYGMIIAMTCSGVISLIISMLVQFTMEVQIATFLTVISCVIVGAFFGALVTFQSILAGVLNGIVGSLMGNMLGAVVKDPTICSLPVSYLNTVEENMLIFGVFGTLLTCITMSLVYFSLKV
ncbi:hypothetical protein ACWE42_10280 [Sutcliffiella cohnii]|uniref:hypothetical protein n=1 Tax=Sutcliffiella cohnii TaxID=33932 RepID=UPI002E201395|nr:hypothetical protein [Sutcliffiella cohnii]